MPDSHEYRVVEGWGLGSDGRPFGGVVPDVSVDSSDAVYITRREPAAILVYDRDGTYLRTFADDILTNPHNIWIDPEDRIYVADTDDHTIREFDTSGSLIRTWGTPNEPGSPGDPFNRPTKAMASATGHLFVSDGYGQHRIHRFSPGGDHELSWGEEGTGPGQFALPHDLWVDTRNRVLVCDRENNRIQLFDLSGQFLEEWRDVESPNNLHLTEDGLLYLAEAPRRVSIFDLDGNLLHRWGEEGDGAGQYVDHPHGICVDSRGDIYVTEVPYQPDRLQKFARIQVT